MARELVNQNHLSLLKYTTCPYYCPPEGYLNCAFYGTEVDIWALGCIWIEMLLGRPYFKSLSTTNQDIKLLKSFGLCNATIDNSTDILESIPIPELQRARAYKLLHSLNLEEYQNLHTLLSNTDCTKEELKILQKIFNLSPFDRISAEELLKESFFEIPSTNIILSSSMY